MHAIIFSSNQECVLFIIVTLGSKMRMQGNIEISKCISLENI